MNRTGWSTARITAFLYLPGAGAMAVNAWFASLLLSWVGVPLITPTIAIIIGMVIAIPLTWMFAGHIRNLMDKAGD